MCAQNIICGIIKPVRCMPSTSSVESYYDAMCAQSIIFGIILRCDVCTEHHQWNHFTMRCVHGTSSVESESSFYVLSTSRDAWSNSGDNVVGGGGGVGLFLSVFMPLAYTVPKSRNASLLFRTLG